MLCRVGLLYGGIRRDFSPAFLQLIYLEAHPRTLHLCTQYFYIPRHLLVGSRYIRLLFSVLFKNFNGMPRLFIKTLLRINRDCDWNFDSILLVAYKFTHRTSCNLWQMPTFCCTRILMTPFSTDFCWHETPKSLMVHFHVPGEFPSARFFLFSSAACKRRH